MRKNCVCVLLAAVGIMAAAGDAFAGNVAINCSGGGVNALQTEFTTTHPGGLAGTIYMITGPCTGNFTITQDNITIEPNGAVNNTINGQVAIIGARNILLQDLLIDGTTAMNPPVTVHIVGPASVTIQPTTGTSTIQKATSDGVRAEGPARVTINTTTIKNNGGTGVRATTGAIVLISSGTFSTNATGAVVAQQGSTVTLNAGNIESSAAPNIAAIMALQSSTVTFNATINTGPDAAPTIVADQNSSISITTPGTIATSSMATAGPAIVALHSSSVSLNGGGSVTGPSANDTIAAYQGSSVFLRGATISATTNPVNPQFPFAVIGATGSSSVVLAGGNDITNSATGGVAVLLADGSSLIQSNGALFGDTPALDTITGNGRIQTQSAIELAVSPETGAGLGGIDWSGDILVGQASSFRADGDNVMIMGTLTLNQAANGYFNHSTGSTIGITSVVCISTTDHVSNPTLVTPNITIGAPPGCALF